MSRMVDEPTTNLEDVEAVLGTMKSLARIIVPGECYIDDAVISIRNANDYPVGWIWYDGECERWTFIAHRDGVEP